MMMKKLSALLLAALLALSLSACGGGKSPSVPETQPQSPSSGTKPAPEPESAFSESAPSLEKEQVPPPEPDQKPSRPQEEVNPDFGMGVSPAEPSAGPVNPLEDEALGPLLKKEEDLRNAVDIFFLNAPEDAYSYQRVELTEDRKLKLEIGVIEEAAVDKFLAGYNGEPWDELVKKPGLYSVARQNEFLKAVRLLEPEPGVHLDGYFIASFGEEKFTIDCCFDKPIPSQKEADRWSKLPQGVRDLAAEMGIREDTLEYMPPRYTPSGDHPD